MLRVLRTRNDCEHHHGDPVANHMALALIAAPIRKGRRNAVK